MRVERCGHRTVDLKLKTGFPVHVVSGPTPLRNRSATAALLLSRASSSRSQGMGSTRRSSDRTSHADVVPGLRAEGSSMDELARYAP